MKLQQLKYLSVIAHCENISRAAEVLHVSQPSLSRAVKELEEEFHISLFHRVTNGVILTKPGEIFLERADHLLSEVESFEIDMHEFSQTSVKLRLGISPMISQFIFPEIFLLARDLVPELHFTTVENGTLTNKMLLMEDQLDMALISSEGDLPSELSGIFLTKTKVCLCVNKSHPLAIKKNVLIQEIQDESLVLLQDDSFLSDSLNRLGLIGKHRISSVVQTNQISSIQQMIKKGNLCSILYQEIFKEDSDISVIPISEISAVRIYLAWKSSKRFSHDVQMFLKQVKEMHRYPFN